MTDLLLGKKDILNYSWRRRIEEFTVEGEKDWGLYNWESRIGDLQLGKKDWGIYSLGRRVDGFTVGEVRIGLEEF